MPLRSIKEEFVSGCCAAPSSISGLISAEESVYPARLCGCRVTRLGFVHYSLNSAMELSRRRLAAKGDAACPDGRQAALGAGHCALAPCCTCVRQGGRPDWHSTLDTPSSMPLAWTSWDYGGALRPSGGERARGTAGKRSCEHLDCTRGIGKILVSLDKK
jgi:hypothetical protein